MLLLISPLTSAWIVNTNLTPLDPAECKDISEKNKTKRLINAYKVASEAHDLKYFKKLLSDHQAAIEQEEAEAEAMEAEKEAEKEAAKTAKEAKKGKRKSKAADTDVEMEDADDSKKTKSASKKRKKDADTDGEAEKVIDYIPDSVDSRSFAILSLPKPPRATRS